MPSMPPPLAKIVELSRVVAAGNASPEVQQSLKDCVAQGFRYVAQGVGALEKYSWGLLWTEEIRGLLSDGFREVDTQKVALHDIELALGEGQLDKVREAAQGLVASVGALEVVWRGLKAAEKKSGAVSPYPSMDKLLKASYNVLNGLFTDAPIRLLYPPAAAYVVRLGAGVKRYVAFYGSDEVSGEAEVVLRNLEMGFGAFDEYLRKGDKVALRDGLKLVAPASVAMYKLMGQLGESAASKRQYAQHPLAEELYRAQQVGLSGRDLELLWRATSVALQGDINRVQYLVNHPLCVLSEIDRDALVAAAADLSKVFNESVAQPLAKVDVARLDAVFMRLSDVLRSEEAKIEHDYGIVAGSDNFEELIVSVGLAMQGKMSPSELRVMLDHLQSVLVGLCDDVDNFGPDLGEERYQLLRESVDSQYAAIAEMLLWCDDGEVEHLRAGWQELSVSLPVLAGFTDVMREKIAAATSAQDPGSTCFRCGTVNHGGVRFCSHCNAPIIQMATATQEYVDLDEEAAGSDESVPENIRTLEDLVARVESGTARADEVGRVVGVLLRGAAGIRASYERQFSRGALAVAKDSDVVVAFRQSMEAYIEGLTMMGEYANSQRMEYLYSGLAACQQAAQELLAARG